jgi:hypothetical protein
MGTFMFHGTFKNGHHGLHGGSMGGFALARAVPSKTQRRTGVFVEIML